MKHQLISILSITVLFLMLFLSSCEVNINNFQNQNKDTISNDSTPEIIDSIPNTNDSINNDTIILPDVADIIQVGYLGATYFGDYYENGTHDFNIWFQTGTLKSSLETGMSGSGEMITIDLLSNSKNNVFPTTGEYVINNTKSAGSALAGFIRDDGHLSGVGPGIDLITLGTFIETYKNGELVKKSERLIVGGTVNIEGTKEACAITLNAKFEDGSTKVYKWHGNFVVTDATAEQGGGNDGNNGNESGDATTTYNYDNEPIEAISQNITFTKGQFRNIGEYFATGSDNIEIYLESADWFVDLIIFAKKKSSNAKGSFAITDTYKVGTCMMSPGGDEYEDVPSFFATGFDTDSTYTDSYYITSGTVEVTDNGVTIDAKTKNGSTIKGIYTGNTNVVDVIYAPAKVLSSSKGKQTNVYGRKRI